MQVDALRAVLLRTLITRSTSRVSNTGEPSGCREARSDMFSDSKARVVCREK